MTEISGVVALLIQVEYPIKEAAPRFTCASTKHLNVLFRNRPADMVSNLVSDFERGAHTGCDIDIAGAHLRLECAGRLMQNFSKPSCWFVGWASLAKKN